MYTSSFRRCLATHYIKTKKFSFIFFCFGFLILVSMFFNFERVKNAAILLRVGLLKPVVVKRFFLKKMVTKFSFLICFRGFSFIPMTYIGLPIQYQPQRSNSEHDHLTLIISEMSPIKTMNVTKLYELIHCLDLFTLVSQRSI